MKKIVWVLLILVSCFCNACGQNPRGERDCNQLVKELYRMNTNYAQSGDTTCLRRIIALGDTLDSFCDSNTKYTYLIRSGAMIRLHEYTKAIALIKSTDKAEFMYSSQQEVLISFYKCLKYRYLGRYSSARTLVDSVNNHYVSDLLNKEYGGDTIVFVIMDYMVINILEKDEQWMDDELWRLAEEHPLHRGSILAIKETVLGFKRDIEVDH